MSIYADSHVEFIHHPNDLKQIPNAHFADSQINPDLIEAAKPRLLFLACYVEPGDDAWERLLWVVDQYQQVIKVRGWNLIGSLADYRADALNVILHLENAVALGNDLSRVNVLHEKGLRSIGLTHNEANQFAGGSLADDVGMTNLGRRLIELVRTKWWIIDAAHLSTRAAVDLYELDPAQPLFISHCGLRTAFAYSRNVDDQVLKLVKNTNGYVGLACAGSFLSAKKPSFDDYLAHFRHAQTKLGNHQIGIGSDLGGIISSLPDGVATIVDLSGKIAELPEINMGGQNLIQFLSRSNLNHS